MSIHDRWQTPGARERKTRAVGSPEGPRLTRAEAVARILDRPDVDLFGRLGETHQVRAYGFGSDMPQQMLTGMFWVRLAFPLAIIAAALKLAERLARPGAPVRLAWFATILPIAVMLLLAAAIVVATPPEYRLQFVLGKTWWATTASVVRPTAPR